MASEKKVNPEICIVHLDFFLCVGYQHLCFFRDSRWRLILVNSDAAYFETSDHVCDRGQVLLPSPPSSFGYSTVKSASASDRRGIAGMIGVLGLDIVKPLYVVPPGYSYLLIRK